MFLWYNDKGKEASMNRNDNTLEQHLIPVELNISDTNVGTNWSSIWLSTKLYLMLKENSITFT